MKIEKDKLVGFLDKISMDTGMTIFEALFNFGDSGVNVAAITAGNIGRIDGVLNSSAFVEYEAIGKIGLQNIPEVVKACKRFDKEIELIVEGNLLTLKGKGKKLDVELVGLEFISSPEPMTKELEFAESFTVEAKGLNHFFDDARMNKEPELLFETQKNKLVVNNTGKFKWTHILPAEGAQGGEKVKFGEDFMSAISKLTGVLNVHLKTNYPIRIIEKTTDSVINILIAPRIEKK